MVGSGDSGAGNDGPAVRAWLTSRLAGRFWEFVIAETQTFADVLQENGDLAKGVFGVLSGDGIVKAEIGEIKTEDGEGEDAVTDKEVKKIGTGIGWY